MATIKQVTGAGFEIWIQIYNKTEGKQLMDIDYQSLLWQKIKAKRQFNQHYSPEELFLSVKMDLWYYGLLHPK